MGWSSFWNAVGAIATIVTLLLSVVLQWNELSAIYQEVRERSIGIREATKKSATTIAKKSLRPLLIILSLFAIASLAPRLIIVTLLSPLSEWSIKNWLYLGILIVPFSVIIYLVIIEPLRGKRKAERYRDLFADIWLQQTDRTTIIPFYFYEEGFPCSWINNPENASTYFERQGLMRADSREMTQLMKRSIKNNTSHKTVFVFLHDVVPASITEVRDPSCTLRQYLDAGGRVVWWGDIPLHWRGLPGNMKEQWAGAPLLLSVDHYNPKYKHEKSQVGPVVLWDRSDLDGNIVITQAGNAIGLTEVGRCLRPAMIHNAIVYSELQGDLGFGDVVEGFRLAISWRKSYTSNYFHSGFMQYPLFPVDCNDGSLVRRYFSFASSGWPFTFPS
jgi:hypothetical protein